MGTTWYYVWLAVCCIPVQIPTPTFSGDFGFSGVASLVLDSAVSWEASEACQECKTCWSWKFGHVGVPVFQFSRLKIKLLSLKKQREGSFGMSGIIKNRRCWPYFDYLILFAHLTLLYTPWTPRTSTRPTQAEGLRGCGGIRWGSLWLVGLRICQGGGDVTTVTTLGNSALGLVAEWLLQSSARPSCGSFLWGHAAAGGNLGTQWGDFADWLILESMEKL